MGGLPDLGQHQSSTNLTKWITGIGTNENLSQLRQNHQGRRHCLPFLPTRTHGYTKAPGRKGEHRLSVDVAAPEICIAAIRVMYLD